MPIRSPPKQPTHLAKRPNNVIADHHYPFYLMNTFLHVELVKPSKPHFTMSALNRYETTFSLENKFECMNKFE